MILSDVEIRKERMLHIVKRIAEIRKNQCENCRNIDKLFDELIKEILKDGMQD